VSIAGWLKRRDPWPPLRAIQTWRVLPRVALPGAIPAQRLLVDRESAAQTRLRPSPLAAWSAWSASSISWEKSEGSWAGLVLTPRRTVRCPSGASQARSSGCIERRIRSATIRAVAWSASGSSTRNSSLPSRKVWSCSRTDSLRALATCLRTRSPASWPKLSLTCLKWSRSSSIREWLGGSFAPSRARRLARPVSGSQSAAVLRAATAWAWR